MSDIIRNQVDLQKQMRNINVERPVATLSLRINADFNIGTNGIVVVWTNEIRNLLFTWSTTDIVIPSDGMYQICSYWMTSTAIATLEGGLTLFRSPNLYTGFTRLELSPAYFNNYAYSYTQYFLKGDILQFILVPSAPTVCLYRAEITGFGGQSGIFHITQLTGKI